MKPHLAALALLALAASLLSQPASAATVRVQAGQDLQAAVQAACETRRLVGQQAQAFTVAALPLCRTV